VVHFAALAYVGNRMKTLRAIYADNVGGTVVLLEMMR